MKTLLPIILCLFAANTFGQGLTVTELQAKAKKLKLKEVTIGYDKFKDQSAVTTKPYNLIGGGEAFAVGMAGALSRGPYGSGRAPAASSVLLVNVFFYFDGQTLKETPNEFLLLFTSGSSDWMFLKGDRKAYFLIDGERFELESKARDSDVSGRNVTEQLAYEISRKDLARISRAKLVEMRLGNSPPRKLKPELQSRIGQLLTITTLK